MFNPSSPDLGTVQVNQYFNYTVTYTYIDPATALEVTAPVSFSVSQKSLNSITNTWETVSGGLPSTINVSSGSISGYLDGSVFNQSSLSYTVKGDETQTVKIDGRTVANFWKTVDARKSTIGHIFSFRPDPRSAIEYNITATAYDGEIMQNVSTVYTLVVQHPSFTPDAAELRKRV